MTTDVAKFKKVFSFNFPDQENDIYTTTSAITLDLSDPTQVTADGLELLDRLILQQVEGYKQIDYEYYKYENFNKFVDEFKGFYLAVDTTGPKGSDSVYDGVNNSGVTYSHSLKLSGFGFHGYGSEADREQAEEEGSSTVVKMVGMTYSFLNELSDYGNNSINNIVRSETQVDPSLIENKIFIESLGGKSTQMRISKSFFEWVDEQLAAANVDEKNNLFKDVFINRAMLKGYIPSIEGYDLVTDPTQVEVMTEILNAYPLRLGMYRKYDNSYDEEGESNMESILDYDLLSEYYYGTTSVFNGYINRTLGLYEMNIHQELQVMWKKWCELDNKSTITDTEWAELDWNRVYIGPATTSFTSVNCYAIVQGANNTANVNKAPIQFDIIYTLRK